MPPGSFAAPELDQAEVSGVSTQTLTCTLRWGTLRAGVGGGAPVPQSFSLSPVTLHTGCLLLLFQRSTSRCPPSQRATCPPPRRGTPSPRSRGGPGKNLVLAADEMAGEGGRVSWVGDRDKPPSPLRSSFLMGWGGVSYTWRGNSLRTCHWIL